jgi:hypothetical protein
MPAWKAHFFRVSQTTPVLKVMKTKRKTAEEEEERGKRKKEEEDEGDKEDKRDKEGKEEEERLGLSCLLFSETISDTCVNTFKEEGCAEEEGS